MPLNRRIFMTGAAATAAITSTPPWAQTAAPAPFPNRVIRIVPFGTAGGPIDVIARVYAEKLQQRWGQSVIVDAKPGASGLIAADYVAKAAPDGHTVMFTLPLTHVNVPILQAKVPYDPVKDFTGLSMLATGGPMMVARANAPYSNIKEFVEFAKKQPKPLSYGTWGTGSSAHLFTELLQRQTGIKVLHAPYKAEAAVHNDLFGDALDFAWANPSTARGHVQAGKMKVLGVTGTRRLSGSPTVPTFTEQGFQGFDIDSWLGVYGPARLPQPIVEAWVTALRDITRMPEVTAKLVAFGLEPLVNTPTQFAEAFKADYPRVAELIKAAGVTAE